MQDYLDLCQTLGCCRELVQGSVGNISVKINHNNQDLIIIKEPNIVLAEIVKGYSIHHLNYLDNIQTIEELFFHCIPAKFVVYLHPKNLLVYLCQKDWKEKTANLSKMQSFWIPHSTLDYTIFQNQKEAIFYLQNHGIIIAANTKDKIYEIIDEIYQNLDKIQISFILEIKKQMKARYGKTYFIMPSKIIMYERFFFSITLNYSLILGRQPVTLENNKIEMLSEAFDIYQKINDERPSLVIIESKTYMVGESYKKCLEIEQILESYMFIDSKINHSAHLDTPIFESQ